MQSSPPVSRSSHSTPSGAKQFFDADRRQQASELEVSSLILRHATYYLIEGQMGEQCTSVLANRDAVGLLCHASRQIISQKRRVPARSSIRAWLRSILFEPELT